MTATVVQFSEWNSVLFVSIEAILVIARNRLSTA